jgi:hypothetical protein
MFSTGPTIIVVNPTIPAEQKKLYTLNNSVIKESVLSLYS